MTSTEQIKKLVQSLKPELSGKDITLTFQGKGKAEALPIRLDRTVKDEGKAKLAALYTQKYGAAMSYRVCEQVLREIKVSLEADRKQLSSSVRTPNATQQTPSQPQPQPLQTPSQPDILEDTPMRNIKLHRASNRVMQWNKDEQEYKPIAEWSIPVVHQRYETTDVQGNTKVEYDLSIQGHREIINRGDISNGRYHSHFPDLSNVENRYLKEAYATLITSQARKAPLIHSFTTTGFYPYTEDDTQKYGYMIPSGHFIIEEGVKLNTHLSMAMGDEQLRLWNSFEARSQTTKKEIKALYAYLKGVTPHGLALFLTSHNARAIGHFLRSDTFRCGHGVLLYGEGGTGKTELSLLCRGIAQPYINKAKLDATFRDTITDIEGSLTFLKDVPVIIDDLNKGKNEGDGYTSSYEKIINRLIRAAYDGDKVRGRRTATMGKQTENFVQTLITITGEYYPSSMQRSTFRRLLTIEAHPEDIHRTLAPQYDHSLEQSNGYSYTLFALGRRVIMHFLKQLNTIGYENTVKWYEGHYLNFRAMVRASLCSLWKEKQHTSLAHDVDNLIDIAAHILLGSYFMDEVSEGATSFVQDTEEIVIEVLYMHICRMEGLTPDEEDNLPFEAALLEMFERIGHMRTFRIEGASEALKISSYGDDSVPDISYPNGMKISARQLGRESDLAPVAKIALLVKETEGKVYITTIGLEALLTILKKHEGYSHLEKASQVVEIADKEGWLIEYGEVDKKRGVQHKRKKIHTLGMSDRCAVIDLHRLLALLDVPLEKWEIDALEAARRASQPTEQIPHTSNVIEGFLED